MKAIDSIPLFVALALFPPITVTATTSVGTSAPFRYSESELEACTRTHGTEDGAEVTDGVADSANTCLKLYERFLGHYHRREDISTLLLSSPEYAHFATTAEHVYQHNVMHSEHGFKLRLNQFADTFRSYTKRDSENSSATNQENKSRDNWQIDLESFWEDNNNGIIEDNNENNSSRRQLRWNGMDVRLLDTHASIRMEKEHQKEELQKLNLRQSHEEAHQMHNEEDEFHRHLKWKSSHKDPSPLSSSTLLRVAASSKHQTKVRMPGDGTNMPAAFSSPQVPAMIHGTEVELHKGGQSDVKKVGGESSLHEFSKFLDWSTSNNPDGVSLVHGVYNQGSCGSCWAFAATGSVEASAARNAARDYFVNGLGEINEKIKASNNYYDDDDYLDRHGYYTMLEDLADESRRIESETFEELNLSIQELLDCDTSVDEGCIGGNPSLAFYYIHKYGLVPWKEYPYVGYGGMEVSETSLLGMPETHVAQDNKFPLERSSLSSASGRRGKYAPTCQKDKVENPIATVESWGLLHKNHEDLIAYALLYVGPVAVGINGADPSFISYGGGIFDSHDCEQTANHALLIVGYGEENTTNQKGEAEIVRYWIARNSWGESWGEKGFIRVKRGSGEKGKPGVCGIARSPSVALGGSYRANRTDPLANVSKKATAKYRKDKYVTSYDTSASLNMYTRQNHPRCDSMFSTDTAHFYNGCVKFSILYHRNQPMFLALICFLCALLAIIPLAVSLLREHRRALGNRSLFLEFYEDEDARPTTLSERSRSSSGTLSERTHLLTLKDMYADARKHEEEIKRPRGRNIVMTSPEHDPFHLVPSASFDHEESDQSYGGVLTRSL